MLIDELFQANILANLGIEHKLHAHAFEDLAAVFNHLFFQFEFRNAEGQQAADFRIAIINDGLDAIAREHIGATQSRRSCADNGDAFAAVFDIGQIRPPALSKGGVGNIFFNRADGDCAKAIVKGAGAFTESVLRTNPAADFRQRIGAVGKFNGFVNIAFGDQLEPVGNIIVHRAFPFTIGIAAGQTTIGLFRRAFRIEFTVDFTVFLFAFSRRFLVRIVALDLNELKVVSHINSVSSCWGRVAGIVIPRTCPLNKNI